MYQVRKLVYYCDFCKKYKLTPFSMRLHEKHCTLNPQRVCRKAGCRNGNCPICRFSEFRLGGFATREAMDFDLKEEMRKWAGVHESPDW